jgi:hypothetical protein
MSQANSKAPFLSVIFVQRVPPGQTHIKINQGAVRAGFS